MSESLIKPCPFCGLQAKYIEHQKLDGPVHYTVGIVCCDSYSCGCRTRDVVVDGYYGGNNTKEDVINIWNTRMEADNNTLLVRYNDHKEV